MPGPPRHNLPKPDKLHSAPWKKEPARRFPLGCSSASVGPACASSASGVWVPSVAPVLLQRPAPAKERAAGVSRGALGSPRQTRHLGAGVARASSRFPRPRAEALQTPLAWLRQPPTPRFPSNGQWGGLTGARVIRPLSLRVRGATRQCARDWRRRAGLQPSPGMGGGGNGKACPLLSCSGHLGTEIQPRGKDGPQRGSLRPEWRQRT